MRRMLAAALGAALFLAAQAEEPKAGGACKEPGCESTAPAPGTKAKAKKAGKERARQAKPEAATPAPKNPDGQEKPKPCEELRPCPID